ncbi:hypothetical protein [Arcticibacter sp.]|uniref:hypothetical protein n=1 Tax=Arcticibacter sp. TaxID=1872630 RepID=UPI00388D3172
MKRQLSFIKILVQLICDMTPPSGTHAPSIATLKTACEQLVAFLSNIFQTADEDDFRKQFDLFFSAIVNFSDRLYTTSLSVKKVNTLAVFQLFDQLITQAEEDYPQFILPSHAMALASVAAVKKNISQQIPAIRMALQEKHISDKLLTQLLKALQDPFKKDKYPAFSYGDQRYLLLFVNQLKSMVRDGRTKDWNKRLRQLLIKNNFNHMGIYKVLEEEIRDSLNKINKTTRLELRLLETNTWLEQLQPVHDLAYQPYADSLKTMLLKFSNMLHQHAVIKETADSTNTKLRLNLSVDELTLELHYRYIEKQFPYKNKKETAQAVANNISSKGTTDISSHSLSKFDKLELKDAAIKVYQRNKRITEMILRDFDL